MSGNLAARKGGCKIPFVLYSREYGIKYKQALFEKEAKPPAESGVHSDARGHYADIPGGLGNHSRS